MCLYIAWWIVPTQTNSKKSVRLLPKKKTVNISSVKYLLLKLVISSWAISSVFFTPVSPFIRPFVGGPLWRAVSCDFSPKVPPQATSGTWVLTTPAFLSVNIDGFLCVLLCMSTYRLYWTHIWLVVEPTHLEKYESEWESSPILGMKIKNIWNHQLVL